MIDDNILNDIFDKELIVYEDVKATNIYVKWDGVFFIIKTELNDDPINIIEDDSMESYYGKAYNYLNNLSDRVKNLLSKRYWFNFQYFPENVDTYTHMPKNNLVLFGIYKNGVLNFDVEELEEYARMMEVDSVPVIFKGKLNEKTIEIIKFFLNTSQEDLEYIFNEKSFAKFFYTLLNPQLANSFLSDDFQKDIEKIIIRVNGGDYCIELLNPLYKRMSEDNKTDYLEIYSIILNNFLIFAQSVDIKKLKLKGMKRNSVYLHLIEKLYNIYVSEVKDDLLKWDINIPILNDKFDIPKEIVFNNLTLQYLEEPKLEYIFKCVYFSFNKKLKESFGVFTKSSIILFNNYVEQIQKRIDEYFNKKSEIELQRRGLVSIDKWMKIVDYSVDGEGKTYPKANLKDEISNNNDKKKKGFLSKK